MSSYVDFGFGGSGVIRTKLSATTQFYVNGATGSDSFDGTSATPIGGTLHGPWATLQHADNVIALQTDLNTFDADINIAAGSYVGVENTTGYYNSGGNPSNIQSTVRYIGDPVTPSNVQITATAFRQIGFGQFAPNPLSLVGVTLDGLDFMQTVDTAVWYDNFYVASPAQGSVLVENCQFDACGQQVPLTSGNISFSGNILINGAAPGWVGASQACTGVIADGNESGLAANMFQEANVTIAGNPQIFDLILQVQASSCLMTGNGKFTGAYNGQPFFVSEHSRLVSPFVSWNDPKWGTPNQKPEIIDGGLFVVRTGKLGLEATGGQLIGISNNYSQPVAGFTLTLGQFDSLVIIDPAGVLATGTIVMASPVIDQQRVSIRSSQTITALTISPGAGQSVAGAPTTIAAGGTIDALYRDANTTWYF